MKDDKEKLKEANFKEWEEKKIKEMQKKTNHLKAEK